MNNKYKFKLYLKYAIFLTQLYDTDPKMDFESLKFTQILHSLMTIQSKKFSLHALI